MKTVESERYRALLRVEKPTTLAERHAKSFIENVTDARENGFALVCAECGMGMSDDSDEHDYWCEIEAKEAAAHAAYLARLESKGD